MLGSLLKVLGVCLVGLKTTINTFNSVNSPNLVKAGDYFTAGINDTLVEGYNVEGMPNTADRYILNCDGSININGSQYNFSEFTCYYGAEKGYWRFREGQTNYLVVTYDPANEVLTCEPALDTYTNVLTLNSDYDSQYLSDFLYLFDFHQFEQKTLTFNNVINPYACLGVGYDVFQIGSYTGEYNVAKGLFKLSDNTLITSIDITFANANGSLYGDLYNPKVISNTNTYYYMYLTYTDIDNHKLVVNVQNYGKAQDSDHAGANVIVAGNSWTSTLYQELNILWLNEDSGLTLPSHNKTRLAVLSSFNTLAYTSGITDTSGNGNYLGNVFSLLGSGFTAIAGILAIQVFPGITLGVFIFIPLTITIVLFIVWLVKR